MSRRSIWRAAVNSQRREVLFAQVIICDLLGLGEILNMRACNTEEAQQ